MGEPFLENDRSLVSDPLVFHHLLVPDCACSVAKREEDEGEEVLFREKHVFLWT